MSSALSASGQKEKKKKRREEEIKAQESEVNLKAGRNFP